MWPATLLTFTAAAFGRLLVVNLMPSAIIVSSTWLSLRAGQLSGKQHYPSFKALLSLGTTVDTPLLLLAIFLVFVLAALTQTFQISFVRFLEGYWGSSRPATAVSRAGTRYHERKLDKLVREYKQTNEAAQRAQTAAQGPPGPNMRQQRQLDRLQRQVKTSRTRADEQKFRHPPSGAELPTRLGNAMLAFERRAGERFGYETIPTWPRLYPHLSERLASTYHSSVDALDAAVNFALAFSVAVIVLAIAAWYDPAVLWLPIASAALALLSYRGAVSAAGMMGLMEFVAFDLHRFDMLKSLHHKMPETVAEEREVADLLSRFFKEQDLNSAQFQATGLTYQHRSGPSAHEDAH